MSINRIKSKPWLLLFAVLIAFNSYSQSAKLYKKFEFDSTFFKRPYSMIITNSDTLYSNRVVEGGHVPHFGKKISGLYIIIYKNQIFLKSYIVKGKLTGYYVRYEDGKVFEDGYFDSNNVRRILKRDAPN